VILDAILSIAASASHCALAISDTFFTGSSL